MNTGPALAQARRSACALSAGPARATGWLVSPRALFLTSHTALGYHVEVEIESDAGDRRPGRVVAVDVGRDLAFVLATDVLPRGPEPMVPLALREMPLRAGDPVIAVAALPGRGLCVSTGVVCSVPRSQRASEHIDTDVPVTGPAGGPLVDADGRAVGMLVRGPVPASATPGGRRARALPANDLRAALKPVEGASDLGRRTPIYRCPACGSPFVPEHDACLGCGVPLPHPFVPDPANAPAERAVRDALAVAGIVANRVRTGPRSWQLPPRTAPRGDAASIGLTLDPTGGAIALSAPVVLLPRATREPFFRLLLTLNDQSTGPFRLALDGERVLLVLALLPSMLRERDTGETLGALVEMAEHFRRILREGFDAPPLLSLDEPPEW